MQQTIRTSTFIAIAAELIATARINYLVYLTDRISSCVIPENESLTVVL